MALEDVDDGFGVVVGGDSEKADDLLVLQLGEGFHGAAFGEDGVDLLGDANVVEQPEVEVVGLHELEGLFDITEGTVAAALSALGGKEDLVAAVGEGGRLLHARPLGGANRPRLIVRRDQTTASKSAPSRLWQRNSPAGARNHLRSSSYGVSATRVRSRHSEATAEFRCSSKRRL